MSRQLSPVRTMVLLLAAVPGALLLCCGGGVLAAALDRDPSVIASLDDPTPAVTPALQEPAVTPALQEPAVTPALHEVKEAVPMPDLRHENAAVVADELADLGFTDIRFGSPVGAWVVLPQNWTVTGQSATPGKLIALTSTVILTCTPLG